MVILLPLTKTFAADQNFQSEAPTDQGPTFALRGTANVPDPKTFKEEGDRSGGWPPGERTASVEPAVADELDGMASCGSTTGEQQP